VPGLVAGGTATISVRPEQLRLGKPQDGGLQATVKTLVYFGTDTHCHLALADGTEIVARLQSPSSGEAGLDQGQNVGVRFAEGAVQRVED
jgi:spermidine/putrescine transport system ATP-binding protein